MRIAFRSDSSHRIGLGHIKRCLALASALNELGVDTCFVCREHDSTSTIAQASGQQCLWLPAANRPLSSQTGDPPHAEWAGVSWLTDATETVQALTGLTPDWIVVDHYALDVRWHEAVSKALGARICVVDDLADRTLDAALLVDHNLHSNHRLKYEGRVAPSTPILGGPHYALLAADYARARRYEHRVAVQSIGIFMGGTDPDDVTSRAFLACRGAAGFQGPVEIVSLPGNPHHSKHLALADAWPPTRILPGLPDLRDFFARHDLQIGAGGGATWERCCIGVPTIACAIAPNQLTVLPQLAALGGARYVPSGQAMEAALGEAIKDIVNDPQGRSELSEHARRLVDGRGSVRVANVLELSISRQLRFRAANAGDEALLLGWANDPEVRRHAFTADPVKPQEHANWMRARLDDPGSFHIVIAESANGLPLGQVRFERDGAEWWIDYSLDEAFRGWGHGRPMLEGALRSLFDHTGSVPVCALVKQANQASVRTFESLGFEGTEVERKGLPCVAFSSLRTGSTS